MVRFIDGTNGLTAERLRGVVSYDPETGVFVWKVNPSNRRVGDECGDIKKDSGYRLISVDCRRYRAHRLAWLYMTGAWPTEQVDHKNGVRSDNRWSNLREATQRQNSANMMRRNNKTGVKGVIRYQGPKHVRFRANIMVDGHTNYLGSFKTLEAAAEAYRIAAEKHFGEFARAA